MRAEALHAVREEMAMTLSDVLLRRTEIGSAAHPGRAAVDVVAGVIAGELGWTADRTAREIASLEARYGVPRD
jgi:glycerol-3-phosphate dehydrogenase